MTARRPRCARCRTLVDVRVFHDRDVVRRRCPACRTNDPIEMCPACAIDLVVHDLCPMAWGEVIR